jgi:hypothetical protein
MRLPARGLKRWLAICALFLAGFTVVAVGVGYGLKSTIISHLISGRGYQVVSQKDGSWRLQVPPDKVPQTAAAGAQAAPVALLPAHWSDGAPGAPGAPDAVLVPPGARQQLATAALEFLKRWETFPAFASNKTYAAWHRSVSSYIAPGSLEVYDRTESFAPSAICPKPPCVVGSSWYTAYPQSRPLTVHAYDGTSAYVIAYGFVRYLNPGGGLQGALVLRNYGLLMRQDGGRWTVTRAVADTVKTG